MYTVKEVAKISHTTVKTLHYYHKINLLNPSSISESGYRLYDKRGLEKLQKILFYKELKFSLKDIRSLLDGEVSREETLIKQRNLLRDNISRFKSLIDTIDASIGSIKKGEELSMEDMFKGFKTQEEWKKALDEQDKHLKDNYDFKLSDNNIDVNELNESAMEAIAFNNDMIKFLRDNVSADDKKVLEIVNKHLEFLKEKGNLSKPEDFMNQTEFFIQDDFHRNMLESQQTGLSYYLNRVAKSYLQYNS